MGSPKVSSAWLQPLIEEEKEILGPDWYPYGIEANRPTIEALLQYTHEHGLTDRRVKLEELFAPSTLRDSSRPSPAAPARRAPSTEKVACQMRSTRWGFAASTWTTARPQSP